jgi:mRNA interferase MazF
LGKLPLKVVVPLTNWKERYEVAPWMVKVEPDSYNGLDKNSSADCFQVRSVSKERFIRRLGYVSLLIMDEIKSGLSKVLSLES